MTEKTEINSTSNSYELLAKLASGGMAEIFVARAASIAGIERYVVLKRVLQHRAANQHAAEMFLDEARLSSQLQHANIAQVHDIGTAGNALFFTMEYVHGVTLSQLAKVTSMNERAIPIACVLTIVAGAAAGLHYAHEKLGLDGKPLGIVHRDVSPSNLMITYEGTVKVVDFGIAKAARRLVTETKAGTVKGKLAYMSPEQCRGLELDRRSDLFSLGIVMWEMLTGTRLFKRDRDYDLMERIVLERTASPSTVRPEIEPDLDAIVMRLLAKSPTDRYQSAEELLEAIEEVAVRSGSVLSTTALGRFVREQCGRHPEPWLEKRAVVEHDGTPIPPEVITVSTLPARTPQHAPTVTDLETTRDLPVAQPPSASTASYSYGALATPQPPIASTKVWRRWPPLAALGAVIAIWLLWPRSTTTNADSLQESSEVPPAPAGATTTTPADAAVADTAAADYSMAQIELDAPPRPDEPIAFAFAARQYGDVVTACAAGTVTADEAEMCVIAACSLPDPAKARHWLSRVEPAKRTSAMAACKPSRSSGKRRPKVEPHVATPDPVERPHPKPAPAPDCTDPLACQF